MLYLGTFAVFDQKYFFGYFWARTLKILLSYLKSAPENLSNCKILGKNKNT